MSDFELLRGKHNKDSVKTGKVSVETLHLYSAYLLEAALDTNTNSNAVEHNSKEQDSLLETPTTWAG